MAKTCKINECLVDRFSLLHISFGAVCRKVGLTLPQTVMLGFVWDYMLEPTLKSDHPEWFPYPSQDTPVHAFIDATIPSVGWVAADRYIAQKPQEGVPL